MTRVKDTERSSILCLILKGSCYRTFLLSTPTLTPSPFGDSSCLTHRGTHRLVTPIEEMLPVWGWALGAWLLNRRSFFLGRKGQNDAKWQHSQMLHSLLRTSSGPRRTSIQRTHMSQESGPLGEEACEWSTEEPTSSWNVPTFSWLLRPPHMGS